jgi:hypothetical protein
MEISVFYCSELLISLPGLLFSFIRVYKPIGVYVLGIYDSCLPWIPYFPAVPPRPPLPLHMSTLCVHPLPMVAHLPKMCFLLFYSLNSYSVFKGKFKCHFFHDFAFPSFLSSWSHRMVIWIVCPFACNSLSVTISVL